MFLNETIDKKNSMLRIQSTIDFFVFASNRQADDIDT